MNYKSILKEEKMLYFKTKTDYIKNFILCTDDWNIWKFQKALRKSEKYKEKSKINYFYNILYFYFKKSRIKKGRKLGITISEGVFDKGLRIYHCGNIVVNPNAHIGKNCIIVGNLCIGNVNGELVAPKIKDNVMLGWGTTIIGDVIVEENVKIAAGAVIVKNILTPGATVGGVPGKIIKGEKSDE